MTKEQQPLNPVLMAQCVAASIIGSSLVYVAVGVAMVWTGSISAMIPANIIKVLAPVFLFAGAAAALGSFQLRRVIEARLPSDGGTLQERMRIVIVSMAVAEFAGVLGLVYALLASALEIPSLLWAASVAATIIHFPTRAWLEKGSRN